MSNFVLQPLGTLIQLSALTLRKFWNLKIWKFKIFIFECDMSNAYVDPRDMLNNFCFHVYAQKWVFVIMSHVTCHISHATCHMLYAKCLCWSLGHAEQPLFSCVSSKVSICNYVTCHMSHVACHMSHVKCLCWSLGHAEQFLFSCLCSNVAVYGWKVQWLFFDTSTLTCEWTNHRAGSQLKITASSISIKLAPDYFPRSAHVRTIQEN